MVVRKLQAEARLGVPPRRVHPAPGAARRRPSPDWIDGENIPATGGCVLALNHISHVDPLTAAHIVYDHGRLPRYLAKSGLFKNKALGFFLRSAGQIPVERLSRNAVGAFDAAVAAVRAGECVVVYPEGTITRDPDRLADDRQVRRGADRAGDRLPGDPGRPVGRPGAARAVRQEAGPVPAQDDHHEGRRPRSTSPTWPRSRTSAAVTQQATDRIMAAITALVEEIRGETAPAERFDPTQGRRPPRSATRTRADPARTHA